MTPKEFIAEKLEQLKKRLGLLPPQNTALLEAEILRLLLSKKFRKYSANDELIKHCKQAISIQVEKKEPINITFLHGAYKLWRLDESPYVDWAELFSLMYYTNWVKGICEIYEPGVWFDFFVDDLIIPKLDNVPMSDIEDYLSSYNDLLVFLKQYQPANLKMTITTVGSRFESPRKFDEVLEQKLVELKEKSGGKLPELTDSQKAMVELNTKATPEQEADPQWREKIYELHNAYMATKRAPGYHFRPEKILVFTQPLASGTTISVGTTKSSIMKFWVGVGALHRKGETYTETILSPSQLESTDVEWSSIKVDGLVGTNFNKIRIVQ
jgi:hypothetical protein